MKIYQLYKTASHVILEQDVEDMSDEEFEEYLRRLPPQDRPHAQAQRQTGFWGEVAAGGLFVAMDTGRILFSHRSDQVLEPETWGTFGGAVDSGENPSVAARREAAEEGANVDIQEVVPLFVFKHSSGFTYYNFLFVVPHEFNPIYTWETQGHEWVEFGNWPSPMHPGTQLLLSDQQSLSIIRKYAEV